MPLHSAFRPQTHYVLKWYQAWNARGGRRHLLRVPSFNVQTERLRVPNYITYSYVDEESRRHREQQWREARGHINYVPRSINAELAQLYCNNNQRAEAYYVSPPPGEYDNRGWCNDCLAAYRTDPSITAQRLPHDSYSLGHLSTTAETWRNDQEGTLYEPAASTAAA